MRLKVLPQRCERGLSVTKAAIFDGIWRVSCERAPHVVLRFPPSRELFADDISCKIAPRGACYALLCSAARRAAGSLPPLRPFAPL